MRRWMPLLLVMAAACGFRIEPTSRPFDLGSITWDAQRSVRVHVPPGAELAGSDLPLLYLEEGHALFFPSGAGDARHAVVPRPSELVSLLRRQDIVIVTVDLES
ncbi:hypothetical protein [Pyxidicoccus xibeiensis]|uniref:hypothetical protein n=1 Tax=Pyxidicoccus xibeiensis TaxID=2906759 RepID=UPI0020A7ECFA|nr:hypothetical protein [Pyxidicoccus xibeiensis]MCP3139103.1 hypothetical protein [Pyxidicoccus xibeiensis]